MTELATIYSAYLGLPIKAPIQFFLVPINFPQHPVKSIHFPLNSHIGTRRIHLLKASFAFRFRIGNADRQHFHVGIRKWSSTCFCYCFAAEHDISFSNFMVWRLTFAGRKNAKRTSQIWRKNNFFLFEYMIRITLTIWRR